MTDDEIRGDCWCSIYGGRQGRNPRTEKALVAAGVDMGAGRSERAWYWFYINI
jgi:hypothetical protein